MITPCFHTIADDGNNNSFQPKWIIYLCSLSRNENIAVIDPDIKIIFEDNHLVAINKPSGWLVHADRTEDITALDRIKYYIKVRYNKPGDVFLNTVHRLDRPVSGILLFAKTSKALSRMNEMVKARKISKKYLCLVEQRPEPIKGKLVNSIAKNKKKNVSFVTNNKKFKPKSCTLHYELLLSYTNKHLLEIDLETGRSHQIRVQLSHNLSPILGDIKYGAKRILDDASIALHCSEMSFIHPVKKEPVRITARVPDNVDWQDISI